MVSDEGQLHSWSHNLEHVCADCLCVSVGAREGLSLRVTVHLVLAGKTKETHFISVWASALESVSTSPSQTAGSARLGSEKRG